jgi:peptidoglycan/xylan/chitin deacetylase (PgdA/CDA1 family)
MLSVLMYHQIDDVSSEADPNGYSVTPEMFARQMRYLHENGYRCFSLDDALHYWQTGEPEPQKAFVLTFDDGFRDLYTTVQPILEPLDFTATIFLVVDQIGGNSQWRGQVPQPLLSWSEIRELRGSGFTFGSHTLNHPKLSTLDDEQAFKEIKHSKDQLEQNLGEAITLFSYPYSDFDARIQNLVAASGYKIACGEGRQEWGLFNIWRTQCFKYDTMRAFIWKAQGLHYHFFRFRQNSWIYPIGRRIKRLVLPSD